MFGWSVSVSEARRRMERCCLRLATPGPAHSISLSPPWIELQCCGREFTASNLSKINVRGISLGDPISFCGGGSHGLLGSGASGNSSSKDPAQASLAVRNTLKLNSRFTVAGILVSSNSDVGVGPVGRWKTDPLGTQGEMSIADVRSPKRRKSNAGPQRECEPGMWHGESSEGTPSDGGTTWS
eukprot:scaffold265038_cov32-Tisochrysis_lutea.AAC.1